MPPSTNVVFPTIARSFLQGSLLHKKSRVTINYPTSHGAILPPFGQPDIKFSVWLQEHEATADIHRLNLLTRDLEFRLRFFLQERLTQMEQDFMLEHIPDAFVSSIGYGVL